MALFDKMLSSEESLFKNEVALDFSYQPKMVPYREQQQRFIASCIQPLFQKRNGRNVFVFGQPGVGKTVALKHVLAEMEEQTDEIVPLYVNCWQKNTTFKIFVELCEKLEYPYTQNKGVEELFKVIKNVANKKSAVFVFDEVDKVEDFDFLYSISEEIFRKGVIVITNYKDWFAKVEERIRSRMNISNLEFKPYNAAETKGILLQRIEYAFYPNVLDNSAMQMIVEKAIEKGDIRTGLYLLREAGLAAEEKSSRKILAEHAKSAIAKLGGNQPDKEEQLDEDMQLILSLVKTQGSCRMGDLWAHYEKAGGKSAYRTIFRKVSKLGEMHFLELEITGGGSEGRTTILSLPKEKKLSEF